MSEAASQLEPNEEDWDGPYWDPWTSLDLPCLSYNSAIDCDFLHVLCGIRDKLYCDAIAERASLEPKHVELIQSIFCSARWAEYGTSPRGCFPNYGSEFEDLGRVIDLWVQYYERHWKEPVPASVPIK